MKTSIKHHYNDHKETIHSFIWRAFQVIGKEGISFLIFILCVKFLSIYDFGLYNYMLAIIFFLIMFGDFGISTATSKYVAEYAVTDRGKLKAVLFNSSAIILCLTLLISLITIFFGHSYLKDRYIYILYLLPLIFLAPMTSLYDGVYRGLKKFRQLAIISSSIGLASIIFIYLLIKIYGLIGALISQDIFYFVLLIGLAIGYKEFHFKLNKTVMKEVGKYSFVIGLATLGYYLYSRISILILGRYNYIDEIATYELLNKIFVIFLTPFTIIGQVIAPNFTAFYAKKKYKIIQSKFKKYVGISILTSILFAILAYVGFKIFVPIFFNKYNNIIFISMILPVTLTYSLNVYASYINSGIIVSTGYAKLAVYISSGLGIVSFLLSLALLHIFGYLGVIYSNLISSLIGVVLLHTIFARKINLLVKNEDP